MRIDELIKAFRNWAIGEPLQNAFDLMELLTDPTPITEEGLMELGFRPDRHRKFFAQGMGYYICRGHRHWLLFEFGAEEYIEAASMGQLRGLLLFVGE